MNKLLSLLSLLAAGAVLSACAPLPPAAQGETVAVRENDYTTGSNIARRKTQVATGTMTAEQADDLRRNLAIQAAGANGK